MVEALLIPRPVEIMEPTLPLEAQGQTHPLEGVALAVQAVDPIIMEEALKLEVGKSLTTIARVVFL